MRRISLWTLYSLLALLVITSCQKENIDTLVETEEEVVPTVTTIAPPANALFSRTSSETGADEGGINLDCITLLFPFNLLDSEGESHEVTDEATFETLFEEQWDSTMTTAYIVDFEFPLNATTDGETVIVIENNEQLGEIFAECIPDGGWDDTFFPAYLIDEENSCYKTVYPISLEDAVDGSIIMVEDEAAFVEALVEKELYFHFPISLTDGEEVVTVENVDQLFDALFSCNDVYQDSLTWDYDEGFEYIYCFMVNFPLDVIVDGEVKTVNNHEELCELMLQGALTDYAYPLTLTSPEGEEVTANSAEELEALFEQCDYGIGEFEESDVLLLALFAQPFSEDSTSVCYTVNYPVSGTYIDENGATQTIVYNSDEEIFDAEYASTDDWELSTNLTSLVYPVDITRQSNNQVITINNLEELFEVAETCSDGE